MRRLFFLCLMCIVALGVVMIVLLIGCRRYVNKSLESGLNQRIEEQAIRTIGVYNAFKDKGGVRIIED